MSYILDALKKSEQEREQGNIPHLQSIHSDTNTDQPKSYRWLVISIIAVVLLATTTLLWFNFSDRLIPESGDVQIAQSQASSEAIIQQISKQKKDLPPIENETPTKSAADTENSTSLEVEKAIGSTGKQQETITEQAKPSSNVVFLEKEIADKDLYSEGPFVLPNKTPADPPKPNPARTKQTAVDGVKKQGQDVPVQSSRQPSKPSVSNIADLPQSIRNSIPDLSFSGHVYITVAERRSIIINGKKLREGDYVNADIKVDEITETGAVFDYQGSLFRLGAMQDWSSR
jgi:general secretion pathway protein B